MDTKQPETLRIADDLRHSIARYGAEYAFAFAAYEAEKRLRALHAENETLRAGYDAARLEIESLQKAATDRHALQATGAHPAPCARYCEAVAFNIERRNLHAENERLRTYNKDARLEIESLRERVQQLGQLARDVNSRRVVELEAQLAAVGAGGVEPLRKRCLHQISEPAQPAAQALDAQQYANRYRYIRCFGLPMDAFGDCDSYYGVYTSQTGECLDAAIDAAISALQGSA